MTKKEEKILHDILTANVKGIKSNILTADDLFIHINHPNSYFPEIVKINVSELLLMNIDFFECFKYKTKLDHNDSINPKEFYQHSKEAFTYLKEKFPYIDEKVNYVKYTDFTYPDFDEDYKWYYDDEVESFINAGFRKIDIELIEAAVLRKSTEVVQLLKQGANPLIEVEEIGCGSEVLDCVGSEDSYYFSCHYIPVLDTFFETKIKLSKKRMNELVGSLCSGASAACIYNIILTNYNIDYDREKNLYFKKQENIA